VDTLLDTVIANTQANLSPVIVNEVHDPGKIRIDEQAVQDALRGLAGGRAWDAAEYGISAEQAARMLQEADTPANRERVMAELRQRAIRRANLDVTNGKVSVFVAGEAPWHGLGVNVEDAVSSEHAIALANLNWRVEKTPLQYVNPVTGLPANAEGHFGIVRADTGALLGAVGSRYEPFQNAEAFDFMDSILGQFDAKYESAGAIYGGSKVWMLVRLPRQAFAVNDQDKVDCYAIFVNSHDGSSAARCFPTSVRVVCNNTLRVANNEAKKGLSIRHTGGLKQRVADAQKALGLTVKEIDQFRETAQVLAKTKLEPEPYFEGLLDAVCDVTQAQAVMGADALARDFLAESVAVSQAAIDFETKRFQRAIDKRENLLEELAERYDSERCGVGGIRGSAWAALQAATESADFGGLGGRQVGRDKKSRRFESVLTGDADAVKQIAYEKVLRRANAG
jgi:phage/plasmid-like protein (TIGR03299 family)